MKYVIALVLVLTKNITFGSVKNETCGRRISAEVAASFRKVPWIDFHSPWRDGVSSHCRHDITNLFESADAGELWALKILDAASGIPSGILMGNIIDFGAYDECVGVTSHQNTAKIQGQHCLVSLTIPSKFVRNASRMLDIQRLSIHNPTADVDLSLTVSLCLPSSCNVDDVVSFVNASIRNTPELSYFEISIARVRFSSDQSVVELTMGRILTISFFVLIASVLLFCTVCDFVVRARTQNVPMALNTLAKFSVYTNTMKLFDSKETIGSMPAIHGIRFLTMFYIITLHRCLVCLFKPIANLSDVYEFRPTLISTFVFTAVYAVDTFFILSGFLATLSFLKKIRSTEKFNVLRFYFHRYIRLTPCVGIVMLCLVFIGPYAKSGPAFQSYREDALKNCRNNWWSSFLYIQNFVDREDMCIAHTWHLAVEMQFYMVLPFVLYPLFYYPKLGKMILGILFIASFMTPAIQIIINDYAFLLNTTKTRGESYIDFFNSYTMTYNRGLPYLVGIILGYIVVTYERQIHKALTVFNWILACLFILFCFRNTYSIQPNALEYDVISEVVHVSLGRLGWSLAMAWIIFACTQGYGGLAARFLSLPIFTVLGRLSFAIYLVHLLLQLLVESTTRTVDFYTPLVVMYPVFGDLALTIPVAFILHVCIETPAITLEEVVRGKQPTTAIVSRPSSKITEQLSALISDCLDFSKGEAFSKSVIETKLTETHFWRTISDILNTSSRCSKKTPAQWAKMWHKWRSGTHQKNRVTNAPNQSAPFPTKVLSMEQELLIFLVAITCGLGEATSFQNSEAEELDFLASNDFKLKTI